MWHTQGSEIILIEVSALTVSFTDWEGTCLAHHGIRGQKWGIRRYQNPDGTLTAEGKARIQQNSSESGGKEQKSRIKTLETLKKGPKRDRVANVFLKELSDTQRERDEVGEKAYSEALSKRNKRKGESINPRWAFNKAKDDYDKTEKGIQYQKESEWLYNEINKKSGSWYFGEGVSPSFKQYTKKSNELREAYSQRESELRAQKHSFGSYNRALKKDKRLLEIQSEYRKLDDSLPSIVLKDIGFPDTPENRKRIRSYIFND